MIKLAKAGSSAELPKLGSKKHQRQEGEDQLVVPLLPQMREYFPSRGDRPPPRWAIPPPVLDPDPDPPDLGNFPLLRPWPMDPDLSMRERWESLKFPHQDGKGGTVYKVDRCCSRFSHQWSKDKMVVRSAYEQQGQPPRFLLSPVCRRA